MVVVVSVALNPLCGGSMSARGGLHAVDLREASLTKGIFWMQLCWSDACTPCWHVAGPCPGSAGQVVLDAALLVCCVPSMRGWGPTGSRGSRGEGRPTAHLRSWRCIKPSANPLRGDTPTPDHCASPCMLATCEGTLLSSYPYDEPYGALLDAGNSDATRGPQETTPPT